MTGLSSDILEQLLAVTAEPLIVADINRSDWPVLLSNPPFEMLAGSAVVGRPLADVIEQLLGREIAIEISEMARSTEETSIPVEVKKREHLLVVKRLAAPDSTAVYCAVLLRGGAGSEGAAGKVELRQALLRAKQRIRDLSRDDPVTGLLNETGFREVLAHDWAVAEREKSQLALIGFRFDDMEAYVEVFGRHATNSCLRRVAQAVRRHLRRASDVAARIAVDGQEHLVVLSHSSEQAGVDIFAARISAAIRDLGLHHPRSSVSRFVTVTHNTVVQRPEPGETNASAFLEKVLQHRNSHPASGTDAD